MPRRAKALNLIVEALKEARGELTQSELSAMTGLAQSTVSEGVRELERRGLARRRVRGKLRLVQLASKRRADGLREVNLGLIKASEYPFVAPFAKHLSRKGVRLNIIVYENGLNATFDLAIGRLDLALTPFVTQLLCYSLAEAIHVIGGGAGGGAFILENPKTSEESYASTRASSMELCMLMFSPEGHFEKAIYFRSGEEALRKALRDEVKYVALWEPYASMGIARGLKPVASGLELGLRHCCTLAANDNLDEKLTKTLAEEYGRAIDSFLRDPKIWLGWYSAQVGIPADDLGSSLKSYVYDPVLEPQALVQIIRESGMRTPSVATVRGALKYVS